MYLAVGTNPDISFAVMCLCQFLNCYHCTHWNATIHIVCYLKGTQLLALTLDGDPDLELVGFSDSSYADCPDTAHSTMGYCFSVGGAVFSWSSHHQKTITNSSCEAEYVALSEASWETLWLHQFLCEVQFWSPTLPSFFVTTMVPNHFHLIPPTIHTANTLTSIITLYVSVLKMDLSLSGASPVTTTLLTSLWKPSPILTSCAFALTLASGDACARRSLWLVSWFQSSYSK